MDKYSSCVWQKGDESIPDIQEVTSIYYTIKHVVESPTFLLYRKYFSDKVTPYFFSKRVLLTHSHLEKMA
jgi:hypothetical protein